MQAGGCLALPLLKHLILEFSHVGVTFGRTESLPYNASVSEWVFWPFVAPCGSQPRSLMPAAQGSELPLVRGYLGTGKPGRGEGPRAVRGPGKAIWGEEHPNREAGDMFGKGGGEGNLNFLTVLAEELLRIISYSLPLAGRFCIPALRNHPVWGLPWWLSG